MADAVIRLAVVELPVKDLEKACRFYGNALGLSRSAHSEFPEQDDAFALFEVRGGPDLCLRLNAGASAQHTVSLAFDSRGSAAISVRAVAAGGVVLGISQPTPRLTVTRISDPDGNIIELLERPPGAIGLN